MSKIFIVESNFKIILHVLKLLQKKILNVLFQNLMCIEHFEIYILKLISRKLID